MSLFQTFIQKVGIVVLVLAISGSVLAADFKSIQASAESGDVNAQLELAEKYKVSVAQLCIRFIVQKGAVPIPKSANPDRIRNNADVFGFEISDEDMERIASLRVYGRIGDPPSVPRTHQVVGF